MGRRITRVRPTVLRQTAASGIVTYEVYEAHALDAAGIIEGVEHAVIDTKEVTGDTPSPALGLTLDERIAREHERRQAGGKVSGGDWFTRELAAETAFVAPSQVLKAAQSGADLRALFETKASRLDRVAEHGRLRRTKTPQQWAADATRDSAIRRETATRVRWGHKSMSSEDTNAALAEIRNIDSALIGLLPANHPVALGLRQRARALDMVVSEKSAPRPTPLGPTR